MDPALTELIEAGDPADEVAVIVRLRDAAEPPPSIRVVSRFGSVVTCRLRRDAIVETRALPTVVSVKAPRDVIPEVVDEVDLSPPASEDYADQRRPADEPATGRGVVVGVVDWGCDFAHPDFRFPDGSTRLRALWDQRGGRGVAPEPYGYGVVYTREAIDRALASGDPYGTLGYNPADADPRGIGSHGTHVLGIAAGNGNAGGPSGVAPEAELIFVDLRSSQTEGLLANLGDSVTILEAVDFIVRTAGDAPVVVNLSMGNHGGPHDGSTLVEQALDALVSERPARACCHSAGNYFNRPVHTAGMLRPGATRTIVWKTDPADVTPNEFECFYPGVDVFAVEVRSPEGQSSRRVRLAEEDTIAVDGVAACRIHHRAHDPNNGKNHIDILLLPGAPPGSWEVVLVGENVADGRYDCWVERDGACVGCQSVLSREDMVPTTTTGTICNGLRTIAVGAYDAHTPARELAPFSSSGLTADGRQKPDLVAPGVRVLSARSAGRAAGEVPPLLTRFSGTSMAAPHVAGTVALMFEAAGRALEIHETRNLLLRSARAAPEEDPARVGDGYLEIGEAVAAARRLDPELLRAEQDERPSDGEASWDGAGPLESLEGESEQPIEAAESAQPLGQAVIGGAQHLLTPATTSADYATSNLDDALAFALSRTREHTLIVGEMLRGAQFEVFRWGPATSLPAPPAIEMDGATVCALVLNGGQAVYFPADALARALRWELMPRVREFYALPAADQTAHRSRWIRRLAGANVGYTAAQLGRLSMPALRLLLVHFQARAIPVTTVRRGDPPADRGGMTHGVTFPILGSPISEPECYLPVIAEVEGRLESINAWDWGAGLSVGPIQINVQRAALFRFLAALWDRDRQLFNNHLGTPLAWSMQPHAGHVDLLIGAGTPQAVTLHARPADEERSYRYFQSGTPGGRGYNPAFRRGVAEHVRDLLVHPFAQELVLETSAWWLGPGLDAIHAAGIPRLDPRNPDRDTFVLKAILMSAFVRYSACLGRLLQELQAWPTGAEKLAHWQEALARTAAPCPTLRQRLADQEAHAQRVFQAVQRLVAPAPSEAEDPDSVEQIGGPPPCQTVRVAQGEFGTALKSFTDQFCVPDAVMLALRGSAAFMSMVATLNGRYVALDRPSLPHNWHARWRPTTDGVLREGPFTGRRVLAVWWSGTGSRFNPAGSLEEDFGYDIIFLRPPPAAESGGPGLTPTREEIGGWVEIIAHETTHAFRRVTNAGGTSTTIAGRVRLAIDDEIATRRAEAAILAQCRAASRALRGYAATTGATGRAAVERDFFPSERRKTYLEQAVLTSRMHDAIARDRLSRDDIRRLDENVGGIDLSRRSLDDYVSDPFLIYYDPVAQIFKSLPSDYENLKLAERVIAARWERFLRDHSPSDANFESAKERVLREHEGAFFGGVTSYTPIPAPQRAPAPAP